MNNSAVLKERIYNLLCKKPYNVNRNIVNKYTAQLRAMERSVSKNNKEEN